MPLPTTATEWQLLHECYRVLHKAKSNVVWEILRQSDPFVERQHYPKGDVYDQDSKAQYFYHAHPPLNQDILRQENGHFHLFLREEGIPPAFSPQPIQTEGAPRGSLFEPLCHLIAISMDRYGYPIGFFTTNRWVTGERWYQGSDVSTLLDLFVIDHAYPSWPLNIWLSTMVKLYHDEIVHLIEERDRTIAKWQQHYPDTNVLEDRRLEVTSFLSISHN